MAKADGATGSGFAGRRADAIALMAAGLLVDDAVRIAAAHRALDQEYKHGNSPLPAKSLRRRLEPLLKGSFPRVKRADPLPDGEAGDLEIVTPKEQIFVEIKAQLEKSSFNDITQADWVRNDTDALRHLLISDRRFARALSPGNRAMFRSTAAAQHGWTFAMLWLADVALLTDAARRTAAGVALPADLPAFLERKYLLHMIARHERLVRLSELPPVAHALEHPTDVEYVLKTTNKMSEVAVPVTVNGSRTVFTYHVYAPTKAGDPKGRHKMHAGMFEKVPA